MAKNKNNKKPPKNNSSNNQDVNESKKMNEDTYKYEDKKQ